MFNSFVIQKVTMYAHLVTLMLVKTVKDYSCKHVKYSCVKVAVICALRIGWKSAENN